MRRRVAIVGGGCAGVAAAWELARADSECEVTLYEASWRLGGKGASGRGTSGRIEEHGLHIWLGYYENAFRLLHEVHEYLTGAGIHFPSPRDVFEPLPGIGVFLGLAGEAGPWIGTFPNEAGFPGDGAQLQRIDDISAIGPRIVRLLVHLAESALGADEPDPDGVGERFLGLLSAPPWFPEPMDLWSKAGRLVIFEGFRDGLRPALLEVAELGPRARRVAEVVDITLASTAGYFRESLSPAWYERMNELDFRAWLVSQGLAVSSSIASPFLASLYNLAFAYESGDPNRPRLAAGVALECAIRTFLTYKGAPFWRMNFGMGEAVFSPTYMALRHLGVKVEFFHRLDRILMDVLPGRGANGAIVTPGRVGRLVFGREARPRGSSYEPLVEVNGLPCWPSEALWEQLEGLENGASTREEQTVVLQAGGDFDHVILAVDPETISKSARELVSTDEAWQAVGAASQTVATQSVQLWLRDPLADLGWSAPPVAMTGLLGGLDSFADMSHLAAAEAWVESPRSILYFCGTVQESEQVSVEQQAENDRVHLLSTELRRIVPGAFVQSDGDDYDMIPVIGVGTYSVLNARGSARYEQSLPGSISKRMSPLDRSITNLSVAGDWTDCGLNVGCVEAAVSSGIMAAASCLGEVDTSRLYGHGYIRPWFREPAARPARPPDALLDSPQLWEAATSLRAKVDAELDRFDEERFDAAMRATHPLAWSTWATDAVPLIQVIWSPDRATTVVTDVDWPGPGVLTAEWVASGGLPERRIELVAGNRGNLVVRIDQYEAKADPVPFHHLLIRGGSGQAVLLLEIRGRV